MSKKQSSVGKIAAVSIAAAGMGASPGWAQELELEVVTVTAQKRTQSVQEVPASLEVVSGDDILKQGYQNLGDMQNFVPTLSINQGTQNQTIMIRGVGTQGSNFGLEQAVATFVDGIHFGRASQVHNSFLDLERVEILRGPQPVHFGQNASAGAISIVTRKPGNVWEGFALGESGRFNTNRLEFGIGGPISETFGIRLAGKYEESDGHLRDYITNDAFPHREVMVGRAVLQWKPTDAFTAVLKFEATHSDKGDVPEVFGIGEGTLAPGRGRTVFMNGDTGISHAPFNYGLGRYGLSRTDLILPLPSTSTHARNSHTAAFMIGDLSQVANDLGLTARDEMSPWNSYLQMDYEFANDIVLTSQTGFAKHHRDYVLEFGSGGPFTLAPLNRVERLKQMSQELRLTSPTGGLFEWMTGIYYQKNEMDNESRFYIAGFDRNNNGSRNNSDVDMSTSSDDATWWSGFATATFNFFDDKASLDVGARYTNVKKDGLMHEWGANYIVEGGGSITVPRQTVIGITPFVMSGRFDQGRLDESAVTPEIALRWRPTGDISLFMKYAEGFKAGGFDTSVVWLPPQADFQFKSESAVNYEVGGKANFWHNRVEAEATLFWSEFEDLQVSSNAGEEARNRTQNVGAQRVRGLELSGRALLTERLEISVSSALMDGEILSFPGANCTDDEIFTGRCIGGSIDRSGQTPIRTPEWQVSINGQYRYPIFERFELSFDVNAMASDGYLTHDGFDASVRMDKYEDLSLTVGFGDRDGNWQVALWGRNLLEPMPTYHPEVDLLPEGFILSNIYANQVKSYGVTLRYNFGH